MRRRRFEIADRLGDGRDARRGLGFESDDHHLVAAANSERHQRHGAARAGAASARAHLDLVGQGLGDARDQCRGPRVDAVRMRDHQRFADHRRAGSRRRRRHPRATSSSSNSASPLRQPTIEARVADPEALAIGDDHRRHEAAAPLRATRSRSKRQQQIAGTHAIAFAHVHLESLAAERHGVDAHVNQDFRAAGDAQRQRVARGGDRNDFAVAGSAQLRARSGSIATPSPSMACAKAASGISVERRTPAREWRKDDQCHVSVPDELDAADDPDGIDLGARESEAEVVLALRLVDAESAAAA